ncbi:MAG: radical SAM protein [Planctomycetaceae bacterium]
MSSVFEDHRRLFENNRFVYPVVSRRSQGVSIGINLNPDKVCNFDCIYCQVNRRDESETRFVDMEQLLSELDSVIRIVMSGELFQHPRFSATGESFRRLNDIAFSGDGEPTTFQNFDQIIERTAELKSSAGLTDTKLVLISNASMFHRPHVQRGLALMDINQGEIWAKLDAGTEDYYRMIERTKIPFRQILDNLLAAALVRPIVIQSLFMRVHGEGPSAEEVLAYANQLLDIQRQGGRIKLIQLYTIARAPAESFVTPLGAEELNVMALAVRGIVDCPVAVF